MAIEIEKKDEEILVVEEKPFIKPKSYDPEGQAIIVHNSCSGANLETQIWQYKGIDLKWDHNLVWSTIRTDQRAITVLFDEINWNNFRPLRQRVIDGQSAEIEVVFTKQEYLVPVLSSGRYESRAMVAALLSEEGLIYRSPLFDVQSYLEFQNGINS